MSHWGESLQTDRKTSNGQKAKRPEPRHQAGCCRPPHKAAKRPALIRIALTVVPELRHHYCGPPATGIGRSSTSQFHSSSVLRSRGGLPSGLLLVVSS